MTILLVIFASLCAVLSWAGVSSATSGVAGICFGCFLGIMARIYQAGEQHRELVRLLTKTAPILIAMLTLGCEYVPPPTTPAVVVTPPPTPPSEPPALPPPTPITLSLSLGRAEPRPGEGLSLFAMPISGQPLAPATYAWEFGDGTAATTATSSTGHVYASAGNYEARVFLTDAQGRTAQATKTVVVTNPPREPSPPRPPAEPRGLTATMICTAGDVGEDTGCNVRVAYNGRALPPSAITNVDWEWGDGDETPNGRPAENHEYQVAGTYLVWADITAETSAGSRSTTAQEGVTVDP